MELPEIASQTGTIDNDRIVYIEDYALQYLKMIRRMEAAEEDKFILYGKKEKSLGKETYIIYGICRQGEERRYCSEGTYDFIGYLDTKGWGAGEDFCRNILLGTENGGEPAGGYYIFYDADDKMKECLGQYYEESVNRSRYISQREQTGRELAELVALSNKEQNNRIMLYIWIRIVVTGILIIFCAIAVVTLNDYGKMDDFVQTAIQTSEWMEEP